MSTVTTFDKLIDIDMKKLIMLVIVFEQRIQAINLKPIKPLLIILSRMFTIGVPC